MNNRKPKEFRFYDTYETASWLEAAASDPDSFIEMPWEDKNVCKALGQFSKVSILHHYIYNQLAVEKRREYRKNIYDRLPDEIEDYKQVFKDYKIKLRNEKAFQPYGDNYDEYEHFYLWFLYHENSFALLWEKITDEVFHLLFANRGFLLVFNNSLATYLKNKKELIPREFRNHKDKIRRAHSVPAWVKKAVYFRDQGKCAICLKDLTCLLSTDQVLHFDHIVPLNRWGINDPCNLQLLCDKCNQTKGGSAASTGIRYMEWW